MGLAFFVFSHNYPIESLSSSVTRVGLFFRLWLRYEPKDGNQTAHQRTDDVEETEREINECRNAENRTLCHSAGSPWNQYARNGSTILRTSAQEFRPVSTFGIFILVDRCIHDDTQKLVAHH